MSERGWLGNYGAGWKGVLSKILGFCWGEKPGSEQGNSRVVFLKGIWVRVPSSPIEGSRTLWPLLHCHVPVFVILPYQQFFCLCILSLYLYVLACFVWHRIPLCVYLVGSSCWGTPQVSRVNVNFLQTVTMNVSYRFVYTAPIQTYVSP